MFRANIVDESGVSGITIVGNEDVYEAVAFQANSYRYSDAAGDWWRLSNTYFTFAEWQAQGYDAGGSINPG